jgi:hypothetical protein
MSHPSLPILAALVAALTFSPLGATAQGTTSAASRTSASASAPLETAELNLPASSSSSSSAAAIPFNVNSGSTLVIAAQPASVPTQSAGGAHPFSGIAFGVKVGTAGVGFDVATPLVRRHLNLRSGASFFTYNNATLTEDNINISGSLKFQSAATMVDWFPFHGAFRISGGVGTYNNTGLNATLAVPAGQSFSLGDTTYYSQPGNPITGNGTFTFGANKVAPRVTIGFGNMLPARGHFRLTTELGFQYQSSPAVAYTVSGGGCTSDINGVYANCGPIPLSSVTSEQNELQNDLTDLKFFPILSIGLSYKIH